MNDIKKRLIDKKYVHKEKDENVLIYNLRRALPVRIEEKTFEDIILPKLTEHEKSLVMDYYIKHKSNDEKDPANYIMYNIPHIIDVDYVKNVINDKILSKEDLKSLLKFYIRDQQKKNYILKKDLTEIDEIQIFNIMKKKDLQLLDYDNREKIAKILERIDDYKKEDIFFSNMFADKEHSFFFEHSIEHVPAMMMIEASRQFLIALCHLYGKIPVYDNSFILTKMEVDFNSYLELNYPIKMVANINDVKKRKDGSWKNSINVNVFFYQNNTRSSTINYVGRLISKEVFFELRKSRIKYKEQPRFIPNGMIYKNISLKELTTNKSFTCRLNNISEGGFQLEFNEPIFKFEIQKFDFFTFFQEIGFVHGKCELKWYQKNNTNTQSNTLYKGGFKITDIQETSLNNLKEGVKRFCFLKTEREYL